MRSVRVVLVVGLLTPLVVLAPSTPAHAAVCSPPPAVNPYDDVPNSHPFCEEIIALHDAHLAGGYIVPGGYEFRPTWQITRQAVASMVTRWALGEPDVPMTCDTPPFPDVPVGHPFCGEIEWVSDAGRMAAFADGEFKPTRNITRQAVAAIFVRVLGSELVPCASKPFPDVPTSHPFCAEIAAAADLDVVNGFADGMFRPGEDITRQAFAAMLWRAFLLNPEG